MNKALDQFGVIMKRDGIGAKIIICMIGLAQFIIAVGIIVVLG